MSPDKEIILIDGSSFLFRAYHALGSQGGLSTRDGQPTHAVFGVANMLKSLIKECQPEHIAMVMDAKGKTFRHEMYAEYKANRPPMPDDLRVQLTYLLKLIPAMGLPLVSIEGVEADDVIGTLSKQAVEKGFHVMIVSSDKDLAQLVNDKVIMVDTMKKSRLDEAGVLEKFGVRPDQIIEYLALMGDASDNIPGVPKVGPKTAVKWLNQFGSLDELVRRADEVGGKVGESLRDNLESLTISRTLATIKCDVDTGLEFDQLQIGDPNADQLRTLYTELEFRSWLKELDQSNGSEPAGNTVSSSEDTAEKDAPAASSYETILDIPSLDKWIARLKAADIFALDTETCPSGKVGRSLILR